MWSKDVKKIPGFRSLSKADRESVEKLAKGEIDEMPPKAEDEGEDTWHSFWSQVGLSRWHMSRASANPHTVESFAKAMQIMIWAFECESCLT